MADISIPRIQTTDRNVNQLQQNIIQGVNSMQTQIQSGIAGGQVISSISLNTGSNTVPHTLGRTPVGAILILSPAAITAICTAVASATITIHASGADMVSLYVW